MTFDQALNRAAALCSSCERCPSDINAKALSWGLSEPDAARLVAALVKDNFLNEERYARAFVNDKFRFQHWGRTKIRYALHAKGISDALISLALEDAIDDDCYLDDCIQLLRQRMRGMALPLSQADRARLYRFAAQRGFETSVISRALSGVVSADDF